MGERRERVVGPLTTQFRVDPVKLHAPTGKLHQGEFVRLWRAMRDKRNCQVIWLYGWHLELTGLLYLSPKQIDARGYELIGVYEGNAISIPDLRDDLESAGLMSFNLQRSKGNYAP